MDGARLLAELPWRPPFSMLDRLVDCTVGERVVTEKLVTAGDPLTARERGESGPLPAVMLLEGMGQSAALLFRISRPQDAAAGLPLLGYLEAQLHGTPWPGERVEFEVRSIKMTASGGLFEASARVGSRVLAEAQLGFGGMGRARESASEAERA